MIQKKVINYDLPIINKEYKIKSMDNDIIIYIYFTDLVDIDFIEIDCDISELYISVYKYNCDIDFDNIYEFKPSLHNIYNNEKIPFKLHNVDYFTIFFKSINQNTFVINNIYFYGKRNRYNMRKLEDIEIYWKSELNMNDTTSVVSDMMSNNTNKT